MPRPVIGCAASAMSCIASIRARDLFDLPGGRPLFLEPVSVNSAAPDSACAPALVGLSLEVIAPSSRSVFRASPSVAPEGRPDPFPLMPSYRLDRAWLRAGAPERGPVARSEP